MLTFDQFRAQYTSNVVDHFLWASHQYFLLLKNNPTMPMIKEWMIQGGRIEQNFPKLLRAALDNDAIPADMKHSVQDNLDDELGHGIEANSHFALYRMALQGLGVDFSEYESTEVSQATQTLLRGLFDGVASRDPIVAISRLTTEELLPPAEFPHIVSALRQNGHEARRNEWEPYFTVHIEGDREHADDQIENLFRLIDGDETKLKRAIDVQRAHLLENVSFYDWLYARANQNSPSTRLQINRPQLD